ncbi:hypothetical protein [Phyllobacterium sp. CL33Tsu]|uniref:hypothetical protein n=1 Tax=Phyllobacterium sp. CL33Tsu TaxID=1798191 RepID=UPI001113D012|nr:hypothetical protein [Phyllobacterium sp. CL33Tsu]
MKGFCTRIGISEVRLYKLWRRQAGPPRVVLQPPGYARQQILIPVAEGLEWERDRQSRIHPSMRAVAKQQRDRAAALRRGRDAARVQLGRLELTA